MVNDQTSITANDDTNNDAVKSRYWLHIIIIISAVPFIQSLITWSWDTQFSFLQSLIRILSLVSIVGEIIVINIARKTKFKEKYFFSSAPPIVKILLLIWIFWAIISLIFSIENLDAYISIPIFISLRYPLHIIFFMAVIHILKNSLIDQENKYQTYYLILGMGGMAYLISLLVFIISVPNPVELTWTHGLPSAVSIRHIANYMALFALALAAYSLNAKKWRYWIVLASIIIMTAFIAWSGSRAAILGLIISVCSAIIFMKYFIKSELGWKKLLALPLSIIIGSISSLLLPIPHPIYGIRRFFIKMQDGVDSSTGRIELWLNTIDEIIKSPFLGHGAGRFGSNMNKLYAYDYDNPHNFILQYFYDWGLIGGTVGLSLVAWLGIKIYLARHNDIQIVFAAIAAYTMLITIGMLEGMFYHPIKIILAIALIAPIFAISTKVKP